MYDYIYRVYLDGAQYVDVVVSAQSPSQGQQLAESMYSGRRVSWIGRKY